MTKKRRRKRSGTSLLLLLAVVFPLTGADKKKVAQEPYALVGGTVFKESGFVLPGADVTLLPNPQPDKPAVKIKKMQARSDGRGEFVFRVPAGGMSYTVRASAKGFQSEEKSVTVQGEERLEVTFQLREESKQ
jgi:hypothetical protein